MTNNDIPEFYFHLIFCFLCLKEISVIARCSKKMKATVSSSSFVSLFKHTESIKLHNEAMAISASNSVFRHLVQGITIENILIQHMPSYLVHFPRLSNLSFTFHFTNDNIFDLRPVFKTIAPRIKEFTINIHYYSEFNNVFPLSYVYFRNVLCSFTKVTCLKIYGSSRFANLPACSLGLITPL
jgi:hypothetical protein